MQVAVLAAMLIASGMVLAVRAVRPAPPALAAALEQLSAGPVVRSTVPTSAMPSSGLSTALPRRLIRAAEAHLGVPDTDLAVIDSRRDLLASRKLTLALAGLLAPSSFGLALVLLDVPVPFVIPGVVGLALAAVGWFLPTKTGRYLLAITPPITSASGVTQLGCEQCSCCG